MVPTFINRHEHHVFRFYLGESVYQGLLYESSLYILFFSVKDNSTAVAIGLSQGKLGDRTVVTENGDFWEVWIEVIQSTCPYWDIINKASLGSELPSG